MRRVHVLKDIKKDNCADAWAAASVLWAAEGNLTPDFEFVTGARLAVSFSVRTSKQDMCSPATSGGYLGAENQAIRVQMVDSGHYTWVSTMPRLCTELHCRWIMVEELN